MARYAYTNFFRALWKSLLDSRDAERLASELKYPDVKTEMISIAVLGELEERFTYGDPLQSAIDNTDLIDEDLETAMISKPDWIEDNVK